MPKSKSENNIILTEKESSFQKVSQFMRKFILVMTNTADTQKALSFFSENAFAFTPYNEKVVVTEEGLSNFINLNILPIKGLKLDVEFVHLNLKLMTSELYEVVTQAKLVDAKTRETVIYVGLSMTLLETFNGFKILNIGYSTNLSGEITKLDNTDVARIGEIMYSVSAKLPFGLLRLQKDGTTIFDYATPFFYSLFDSNAAEYEEIYGNDLLARVHPDDATTLTQAIATAIADNSNLSVEIRFFDRQNNVKFVELSSTPSNFVSEPSLLITAVDRTREKQILELIKYSEKAINATLTKEKQLFFNYDFYNDTITFDDAAALTFGVPKIFINALNSLVEKQIVDKNDAFDLQNLFGKIARGENEARAILKIKGANGKYKYSVVNLARSLDADGNARKAIGVITPINAQQEIEVFKQQYQFATTMILRDHEFLVSFEVETGNIESVMNHSASSNSSNSYVNFYEKSAKINPLIIHPDYQEEYSTLTQKENFISMFNQGKTSFEFEHKRKYDDDYIYMNLICAITKSETTDKLMAYFYLKNIDEQKRLQLIYQYKSEHDELTKLYNRDTAKKITSDYLDKSTNGMLHSCLLVDLTNLKDINEISGHVFGDQLIENFSDKLKKMFGNSALLSRFTGNQFFLFLPNIPTKEYATEKAKQIVEFFNNSVMRDPKLYASVGISFYPFDGRTFGDLYQATDQALVEAKKLANRQSNYLRTEDITQARLDREALRQADRFGTTENSGMAFETVNKRGAYQYFAKTNLKYWTLTAIITMAVIVLIGVLEVIFADQLANIFVNQKIAIFLIPLFTAVLLITVSVIYFTSKGQIKKILYVDKVTMGNSKMLFDETAENYIKKNNLNYAYVYSNIVNFKLLNERFGSNSGDAVLRNLYGIISSCLEKDEVCGRIVNDKFGILVKYDHSQAEVIEKIKRISRLAFRIADDQGVTFGVTTKFGIYFIEDNNEIFSHYSNRAELALTKAVDSDKEIYHVYDTDLKSKLIRQKELEGKMQDALFNNNFKVFLQPKVSVSRGIVIGAEALVRWVDHGSLIMPSEFIHIFEENGFITQLDLYMFQEVCRAIKEWETSGKRIVPVSVNVSKKSLAMRDFVHLYKRIMDKYKIDKRFIQFEITETMMIDDYDRLSLIISKIHSMGCTCSIDDFGTGFSSLSVLKNVNVDAIKIDRSFFLVSKDDKEEIHRAKSVVTGIVYIAKSLDMQVIAEGVEDQEQIDYLRDIGCDFIQSFAFYRPLPLKEFERLIS